MIGNVLIGELRRGSSAFLTFAVPFIAAFVMVMRDLTFDPRASTIEHQWIWEQGGGYFGVPLTNYLGWFFTVYLFLQLFALFVRFRPGDVKVEHLPRSHFAQAVLMYAVMGADTGSHIRGWRQQLARYRCGRRRLADEEHRGSDGNGQCLDDGLCCRPIGRQADPGSGHRD